MNWIVKAAQHDPDAVASFMTRPEINGTHKNTNANRKIRTVGSSRNNAKSKRPKDRVKMNRQHRRWFVRPARLCHRSTRESSFQEARLRTVAEQFCTWLYDLGGESNVDIDPAVVRNLFSTAYDTKPSLSVPIKIVEMTRVSRLFFRQSFLYQPRSDSR